MTDIPSTDIPSTDIPSTAILATLQQRHDEVSSFVPAAPHDHLAKEVVLSAIDAAMEGNAAIGALLTGPDGRVILSERNRMFVPHFRSDFHAEMVLLTAYEQAHLNDSDLRGHTLVTSLEPCEMCMIRIINSGVSNVLYVAPDRGKGAITGPNQLAPHWVRLAEHQHFAAADADPRLGEIALEAFEITIGAISGKLLARRLPNEEPDA